MQQTDTRGQPGIDVSPEIPAPQGLADLMVVTALVRLGGEASTALAALYVVVIAGYALLLPVATGVRVAIAASVAYVGAALWENQGDLPPGLWGQLVVFGFVFVLVAVLGHRLQHTMRQQTRLESELQRVRLEASEVLRGIKTGVITVDAHGLLAFANPAAERLRGLDAEALMGRPVLERLAETAPERQVHRALERLAARRQRRRRSSVSNTGPAASGASRRRWRWRRSCPAIVHLPWRQRRPVQNPASQA